MKKSGIILVMLLWILAGVQIVRSGEPGGREKVMEVLGQLGSTERCCVINYYGILDQAVDDKKEFLTEAARALEGSDENIRYSFVETVNEDGSYVTAADCLAGTLKLAARENGGREDQYFFAEISYKEDPEKAFARREALKDFASGYMKAERSSVNVEGSFDGELTLEERDKIADQFFSQADARVVSENRSMEFYTIYGYTPYIREYQLQNGSAVNINIAMHYDTEEDRTYIYAAVPVIEEEY